MAETRFFNLLKPIETPKSSWDKIYDWILDKARIVILVMEIVMVILFFIKVGVDNTQKNRIDEFDKVNLELKSFEAKYEEDYRVIQNRVREYLNVWLNTKAMFVVLDEVNKHIGSPQDDFSITLSNDGVITIDGYESLETIKRIEEGMKASELFTNVSVTTLSLQQSDLDEDKGRYTLTGFVVQDDFKRPNLIPVI